MNVDMKTTEMQSKAYRFGKQYAAFIKMMLWFKSGKTGIYCHPNFVMIDWNTYRKLEAKRDEDMTVISFEESNNL